MSLSDADRPFHRRRLMRLLTPLALGASLALAGCFRPLYGPSVNGQNVAGQLAAVEVAVTQQVSRERLAHYLEQELRFALTGGDRPPASAYRLEVTPQISIVTSSINQTTGQAVAAIVRLTANYRLVTSDGSKTLTSGVATASAGYDRWPQRFANLRAERDAEQRAVKTVAEQIQTRLASWFASQR
ncbi:LPS assembly lipoprotein LptE [Camelimonas abortus]|uniref:LPS assembly lipoprotein LptE n=1 Tax=Camelimonas abortus TaxID=1017184 RepID=A0ABV7LCH2_9HYPH